MEGDDDASITIELVHQKIGRNLLLFQKLEYTLKMMVAMSEISGYATNLEENIDLRTAWAMKKTLGQIVGEHVESFNSVDEHGPEPSPMRKEPHLSMRITTQCEDDFLEKRKSVLAGLVKERNDLVHHLLATYKLNDEKSRRQLVAMLDNQHQRLKEEVDFSYNIGKRQFETRQALAAWLQSEEGREFMVSELRKARKLNRRT
ncbi:hypothetical protein AN401_15040 [Zobellella denitrificans]|uniref:Uncharacterized protein n=1 Tax=Zobellella denitrificans TaxID=347534 RepID=A0A291HS90_9GAMM|nr:hypothetical protein [Zobellella denitrificans]ATG75015.1 hypothetical protein AN401_15040 [Zobellella denitrificans]